MTVDLRGGARTTGLLWRVGSNVDSAVCLTVLEYVWTLIELWHV